MKFKFSFFEHYFSDDEFMFKLSTSLKFVFISLGFAIAVLIFTYLLVRIDLIYFVANGYPGAVEFQEAFYDFIYSSLIDEVPYAFLALIFIFLLSNYLSIVMLRPFKVIGSYCEECLLDKTNQYLPDYFSDLKLLTSFSMFFFSHIDNARTKGKLSKIEIPGEYTRIHKPIFEKNFFINYFLIIIVFGLLASVAIFVVNNVIRDKIFELSQKFLTTVVLVGGKSPRYFIEEQFLIADLGVYFFLIMHMLTYCLLGFHLYSKISDPSFAVFATMRSFLKGNYHSRVHLIGHYYLRNDCRKINKYLDYIQKNLT